MNRGDRIRLTVERPAAGGRMIARHEGAVVLVSGAIPGEVVEAEIEKVQRGTVWAAAREVIERSPDRLDHVPDGACGGSVLAHVAYGRQRDIKSAIISDTLRRIGRITLDTPVDVAGSPIDGYRMRARLHMRNGRIGFFREGTHSLCDARQTRQLSDAAMDVIGTLERSLARLERPTVAEIELAENVAAAERVVHLELLPDADPSRLATLTTVDGLTGATAAPAHHPRTMDLWGSPYVTDRVNGAALTRHARSFFQGNRYLLHPLADHVTGLISAGPILDLYAGVGLFSVAAAGLSKHGIVAVEGDRFSAADLRLNASTHDIRPIAGAVEDFLRGRHERFATVIVDPPRTGMSREATAGVIALSAERVIYVSCDIATLARDARQLLDAGYRLGGIRGFDLFPNTAHVETVISFAR